MRYGAGGVERRRLPFLFNHFQEIMMVYDALKNRAKRKPVMSAESSGESDDRYCMRNARRLEFGVGMLDLWVKVRQQATIAIDSE